MELFLRRGNAQRGAREAVQAAMYVYVKKEPVSSSIIAIATANSSLSPISLFVLGAKDY
jgi:hypothetical protein